MRLTGFWEKLSQFHATHGFYVHGVPIEAAVLPPGWEARAWRVRNRGTRQYTGWCIEAHDLAVSKLVAFREKDRDFVRILLTEGMVDPVTLIERIHALPGENRAADPARLIRWIEVTIAD